MPESGSHTLAAAGVIRDATGRVLLIKTSGAGWELPGGRVESGEDLLTALVREVHEETCCEIAVGTLGSVTTNVADDGLVMFTFRCSYGSGDLCAGDDSLDAGWFDADRARALVTHPVERLRLADALLPSGVVYRSYRVTEAQSGAGSVYELLGEHRC